MRLPPLAPTISQEKMLFDQVLRLSRLRTGRMGVCLHFSKLSSAYNRDRFKSIAQEAFSSYISGFEGMLFPLKNGDLFFLTKDVTLSNLEAAVDRIKLLFTQDPVIEKHTIEGKSPFCTYYNLEEEFDDLLDWVKDLVNIVDYEASQKKDNGEPAVRALDPIQPNVLAKLENALRSVDVTNIARRQTVCTLIDGAKPQPLFEEIYVSIDELQKIIIPDTQIGSNKWLFQYLTHTLDYRLMDMLIRDGVNSTRPFSLNLNVNTVLSPEFAKFEGVILPQLRGRLVIELSTIDVTSDMGSFLFARDYLHDHGFRICLDGVTHHTMPFFNRSKLGLDLIKLHWTPNGLDVMLPSNIPDMRNNIMEMGQAHIILCRCDNAKAVRTGQELGIVMFQGREVDRIMTEANITHESRFYG